MDREEAEESLEELAALGRASGARVVDRALQSRSRVDGRTFIGGGKAEELRDRAAELGVNLLLVDHDLSPAQARNLEKITDVKVLDRTELILDIFARRARTPQAKLQVEAAQLEYLLPRLTRLWDHLSRTGGGIGTRGPGETQLEVDRRRIRDRLTRLRQRLTTMSERLDVQRNLHPTVFRIALVGYTNAGKSSLMNRLTKARVEARDRLFETLDATTRVLDLGKGTRATLTDTVGFIRRLPHTLVESFRATLQEVARADLLLHVIDVSSAAFEAQARAVERVLEEIDAQHIRQVRVYNKCDVLSASELAGLRKRLAAETEAHFVSAAENIGIGELRESVGGYLRRDWMEVEVDVPPEEGEVLAHIRAAAEIVAERRTDRGTHLRLRVSREEWSRLGAKYGKRGPAIFGR